MAGALYGTYGVTDGTLQVVDIQGQGHFTAQSVMVINDSGNHIMGLTLEGNFALPLGPGEAFRFNGLINQLTIQGGAGDCNWRVVASELEAELPSLDRASGTGGGGGGPDLTAEPFLTFGTPSHLTGSRDITHLGTATLVVAQQTGGVQTSNILDLTVDTQGSLVNNMAAVVTTRILPAPAGTDGTVSRLVHEWIDVSAKNSRMDIQLQSGGGIVSVGTFEHDGLHATNKKIQGLANGTASTDAVTKGQLDSIPGTDAYNFLVAQSTNGSIPTQAAIQLKSGLGGGVTSTAQMAYDASSGQIDIAGSGGYLTTVKVHADLEAHDFSCTMLADNVTDVATSSVSTVAQFHHGSSGTTAPGFGGELRLSLDNDSGSPANAGSIQAVASSTISGAEESDLILGGAYHGSINPSLKLMSTGEVEISRVLESSSGNALTLNAPSGYDILFQANGSTKASLVHATGALNATLMTANDLQAGQLEVGGGFGSSGVSIDASGNLSADGEVKAAGVTATYLRLPWQDFDNVDGAITKSHVLFAINSASITLTLPSSFGANMDGTVIHLRNLAQTGAFAITLAAGDVSDSIANVAPLDTWATDLQVTGGSATFICCGHVWYQQK